MNQTHNHSFGRRGPPRPGEGRHTEANKDDKDNMACDDDFKINLQAYDPTVDGYYDVYGDGSWTAPEKWWASLGGFGLWIPQHPDGGQSHTVAGGAVGQDGSSTKQEIAGWIAALTLPFKICYATDSAALIAKTNKLLQAGVNFENLQKLNSTITAFRNPIWQEMELAARW